MLLLMILYNWCIGFTSSEIVRSELQIGLAEFTASTGCITDSNSS